MTVSVWADNIVDKATNRPLPNTTFTVYTDQAATTLATIYTDATGDTVVSGSTVTSDAEGNATVYAASALLWGKVAGQSFTFPIPVPMTAGEANGALVSVKEQPPTPQRYGAAGNGVTDDTTALADWAAAGHNGGKVPPGSYLTSEPVTLAGMNVVLDPGSTIKATATMSAVVQTDISADAKDGSISGAGVIDANDLADFPVHIRYFSRYDLHDARLRNGHAGGVKLGDADAVGRSAEANLQDLHIDRDAALSVVSGSQGILVENSGDGTVGSVIINAYDIGMYVPAGGNMMSRDVHVWTPPAQGSTTTSFEDHSNNSHYQQCHADTPSTYGWRLYGFQTTLVQCGTYINPTAGNATDNQVVGIKFEGANSIATILGHFFLGGSASKRMAYDILAADGNYDLITVVPMPGQFVVNTNAFRARLVGLDVRDSITSKAAFTVNPATPVNSAGFGVQTAGKSRWAWLTDGAAEGGSNAGSGYRLVRYADDGTQLGEVIFISRSSGTITVKSTLLMSDAVDLAVGSTTGTKIGTSSAQKLGFWGTTPVTQPSLSGQTAGFTAGTAAAVTNDSTFTGNWGSTGYTITDLVQCLKKIGLLHG